MKLLKYCVLVMSGVMVDVFCGAPEEGMIRVWNATDKPFYIALVSINPSHPEAMPSRSDVRGAVMIGNKDTQEPLALLPHKFVDLPKKFPWFIIDTRYPAVLYATPNYTVNLKWIESVNRHGLWFADSPQQLKNALATSSIDIKNASKIPLRMSTSDIIISASKKGGYAAEWTASSLVTKMIKVEEYSLNPNADVIVAKEITASPK